MTNLSLDNASPCYVDVISPSEDSKEGQMDGRTDRRVAERKATGGIDGRCSRPMWLIGILATMNLEGVEFWFSGGWGGKSAKGGDLEGNWLVVFVGHA